MEDSHLISWPPLEDDDTPETASDGKREAEGALQETLSWVLDESPQQLELEEPKGPIDTSLIIDELRMLNSQAMLIRGFDSCIVGIGVRCGNTVAVYDLNKMLERVMSDKSWNVGDAHAWLDFNVLNRQAGENAPVVVRIF